MDCSDDYEKNRLREKRSCAAAYPGYAKDDYNVFESNQAAIKFFTYSSDPVKYKF